jgi:glycosyltransferase involved in cell wall biosynthesis
VVSIILPTYNRAVLLRQSIQSVLDQSYTDFELIIVDDGSTDATRDEVQSGMDPRIRYFQLPHTGCTGRLKNFAIAQSRGEFLAFIDSDDMWKAGKLEKQLALFSNNQRIGFSITDVTTFQDDRILIDHSYHLQNTVQYINIFKWLKQSRFLIYNPTLLMKKGCLERTGYFDESMRSGDYHFNMRLAYHFDAGIIYESLLWRRVHDDNLSNQTPFENYEEYLETFAYLHREKMIEKRYLRKARGNAFYKMAKLYSAKGDRREARQHYLSSLRNNPFQWRAYRELINAFGTGQL